MKLAPAVANWSRRCDQDQVSAAMLRPAKRLLPRSDAPRSVYNNNNNTSLLFPEQRFVNLSEVFSKCFCYNPGT